MKRVRCPKCDNFITFDETKYQAGQSLVFVCPNCNKQFGIRMGVSKLRETRKEEKLDENANENGDTALSLSSRTYSPTSRSSRCRWATTSSADT